MEPEVNEAKVQTERDSNEAASARRLYLEVLQCLSSNSNAPEDGMEGDVRVVLRDSDHVHEAKRVIAFSSDSSTFVVKELHTVLGVVPTAIVRSCDVVSICFVGPKERCK